VVRLLRIEKGKAFVDRPKGWRRNGEGDWHTWRRPAQGTEALAREVEDGDGRRWLSRSEEEPRAVTLEQRGSWPRDLKDRDEGRRSQRQRSRSEMGRRWAGRPWPLKP